MRDPVQYVGKYYREGQRPEYWREVNAYMAAVYVVMLYSTHKIYAVAGSDVATLAPAYQW